MKITDNLAQMFSDMKIEAVFVHHGKDEDRGWLYGEDGVTYIDYDSDAEAFIVERDTNEYNFVSASAVASVHASVHNAENA